MKIRIEIEYDPDWALSGLTTREIQALLEQEKHDWLDNNVTVSDVIEIGGTFTLRNVP